MITLTWQAILLGFLGICGGFSTICVAIGWLIKIIKGIRKPGKDIQDKLERDYRRINQLQDDMSEIRTDIRVLKEMETAGIKNDLVLFAHLRTNNSTGEILEREKEMQTLLIDRK